MRELKRKLKSPQLSVRLWTLKDKKSMFRASDNDRHIVELSAKTDKNIVILREWVFVEPDEQAGKIAKREEARAQYDNLVQLLG